ncbi:MAG TPA: ABC transporter permease [Gemmatimonadaceae bacterium]|jgi:predicted permease
MRWWKRTRTDADFRAEIDAHLALESEQLAAESGISTREAELEARKRFGNVAHATERFYEARRFAWIDRGMRDLHYAFRTLRRSMSFTIVAVLTIGFGVGLNTSIFTVLYSFLLRPLPVQEAEQMVNVFRNFKKSGLREVRQNSWALSYGEYLAFRDENTTLDGLSVSHDQTASFTPSAGESEPIDANVQFISCNYFQTLHVRMAAGRPLDASECAHIGDGPVTVLADGFWRRQFGADASIVGRTITVNQVQLRVVGIAPPGFEGVTMSSARAWIPVTMHPALSHGRDSIIVRDAAWLDVVGRLKPGVTREQARADLQTIAQHHDALLPNRESIIYVNAGSIAPGGFGEHEQVTLSAVLGAGAIVLLMACANVMSLLLARAASRRREIGVRLSIGASRRQLVAQLMTESLVLATVGGVTGLAIVYWFPHAMVSGIIGMFGIDRIDVTPDHRVFTYALVASAAAAIAFGLLPAIQATRMDLTAALRNDDPLKRGRGGMSRARSVIVGIQVAGSVVLLIAAGLFVRSSLSAQATNPGFDTRNLFVVSLDVARQGYPVDRATNVYRQVQEAIAATPGVASVALTRYVPLDVGNTMTFTPDGVAGGDGAAATIRINNVAPEYFPTIGVRLLRGRAAASREIQTGSDVPAVISAKTAERFWPGQDPIGRRFHSGNWKWIVTGVAADVRNVSLAEVDQSFIYQAAKADPTGLQLIVRTTMPLPELARVIPRMVHTIDPHLLITAVPYETLIDRALRPAHTAARLTALVAALAAFLAIVGVYGVVNFSVNQRTRELGVRMALGASRRSIVALVMRDGMGVVGIGLVAGTLLSAGVAMVLRGFLYGVSPFDPIAFVGMGVLLVLSAFVAMCGPAHRATKVDPVLSLRAE